MCNFIFHSISLSQSSVSNGVGGRIKVKHFQKSNKNYIHSGLLIRRKPMFALLSQKNLLHLKTRLNFEISRFNFQQRERSQSNPSRSFQMSPNTAGNRAATKPSDTFVPSDVNSAGLHDTKLHTGWGFTFFFIDFQF